MALEVEMMVTVMVLYLCAVNSGGDAVCSSDAVVCGGVLVRLTVAVPVGGGGGGLRSDIKIIVKLNQADLFMQALCS